MNNMIKTKLAVILIMGSVALGMTQTITPDVTTPSVVFNGVRFCSCVHETDVQLSYWWTGCVGSPCFAINGTRWILHNHLPFPWTHSYNDGDFDTYATLNYNGGNNCHEPPDSTGPDNFTYIEAGYSDGSVYTNEPIGWYLVAYSTHPAFYAFGLTYDQFHGGTIVNQSTCGSQYLLQDFDMHYAGATGGTARIRGIP